MTSELSPKQLVIAGMLSKANKVIAYDLGMSESTVKAHVRSITQKLGVTNRTAAVVAMARETVKGSPAVDRDALIALAFEFLCRVYVQRSDARQQAMGLQYTEAETHDLAREMVRFALGCGLGLPEPQA